jgi:MerR family transcriptional regulator, redox-sensitive transcriptional activator SoxR
MPKLADHLSIGEVAERTGVSVSALRFYEAEGMVTPTRSPGGQRRYPRDVLRRVAFIRVAQRVGLTLDEIREALTTLPEQRTPTAADWARLSRSWKARLDERIRLLESVRDDLSSCIGCGCLSLQACRLYNPGDGASALGQGPRYLLGNSSVDVVPELRRSRGHAAGSD